MGTWRPRLPEQPGSLSNLAGSGARGKELWGFPSAVKCAGLEMTFVTSFHNFCSQPESAHCLEKARTRSVWSVTLVTSTLKTRFGS